MLHDLTLALAADRVVAMAQGRIAADGVPGDESLHAPLATDFDGALRERNESRGPLRWVSVPLL